MCKVERMTNSLTRPLLTILACLTTACTAPGEVRDTSDDQAFLFPRIDRAVLTVSRARSVAEDGCSYRVSIDSHEAGSLAPKGWITMYPPAGTYLVSVHAEGGACAAALQMRTRLDVHHEQRLQLVRAANGSLRWNDEEPPWPY